MKILSISDFPVPELKNEYKPELFKDIDLVLACGDLPPEYLTRVMSLLNVPLFYVKGNHDIRYESSPPSGCLNLHCRFKEYKGYKFIGFEGSNWYNGGPNQYTDIQMKKNIKRLRTKIWLNKGVDVVIAHAPPLHINDAKDRCHMGFESFRWLIQKYSPDFFIHGHIHKKFSQPEDRNSVFKNTTVMNTCGYNIFELE